jgi:hypothetical protein
MKEGTVYFGRTTTDELKTYKRKRLLTKYNITYLITPWNWVLLEKLTGSQLVQKSPTFYGTQGFITAFTRASHLSLC